MDRLVAKIQAFIRELRRRRVIRVAVVYAGTAFVLLQLGEILVEPFGLPGWTLRLITLLLVLGFPLAVGLAWVFDVTEEGLVRTGSGEKDAGEVGAGSKPFTSDAVIIGLLVLIAGLLLYPRLFSSGEETAGQGSTARADTARVEERSLAVLPFEPLSSGEKSRTFARGVHDDLLTRLSNISDLTVISRTSVQKYRDTDLSLPAIADSLGVRWVMEGGVQKAGDQIQVNAQLIDPRSDAHVWADDYRRDLTAENLFAIQGEITREIADALQAKLTAGEQKRIAGAPTQDLKAYRLYVQGRSELNTRSSEGMVDAIDYFQQAIRQDSSYALAWAGLADAISLFPGYGPDSLDIADVVDIPDIDDSEEAALRALELDPNLAEAHASLGYVYLQEQDGPRALQHLRRAVKLRPSYAQAHHWLGLLYLNIGRPKKAHNHASLAAELNPQHLAARGVLPWVSLAQRRVQDAQVQLDQLAEIREDVETEFMSALLLYHSGQWDELSQWSQQKLSEGEMPEPMLRFYLARAAIQQGDTSSARRQLEEIRTERPDEMEESDEQEAVDGWLFYEGLTHAALGNTDALFQAWQEVEVWSPPYYLRFYYPAILDPVRDDPRYEELIQEINRQWGLNPDGSIPEETSTPTEPQADA